MTETEPTDLTSLMSLDPLDLTKQDLDKIITYQRRQRQMREGGTRTRKESGGPAVDIKALMSKIQPAPAKPVPSPESATGAKTGFIRRF